VQEQEIASWESWKNRIGKMLAEGSQKRSNEVYVSDLLFRGHKCASWKLESTLERKGIEMPSVDSFSIQIKIAKLAFESYFGTSWPSGFSAYEAPSPPDNYEFMVYLRHHGYPTPLLDWSRSPYIATFFAFQNPSPENSVAIYSYREYTGREKGGLTGESNIVGCGPIIRTHKRHYAQQAEYTYCRKKEYDKWYYSSHEQAFEASMRDQDVIEKFVLPSCIRKEVLAELDAMNINAYTLYGTEEGLAEMLANREYAYES
jgi:hypothetical protein